MKAAGFNAIRIPVAWSKFPGRILLLPSKESWLERVEEVGFVTFLSSGMYAIINEHWDNGWIQPTYADSAYGKKSVSGDVGKQIAIYFRDYDDHLLFAGTNEVMKEGNWGEPYQRILYRPEYI